MSLPDVSCRDRRYSDGLHQAIEAKEHVKVKKREQDSCDDYIPELI